MNDQRVLILGGGLSAAFAWRACCDCDIMPDVIAARIFVPPGGCIWVHWLPASIDYAEDWEEIQVATIGKPETYARKMWGKYVQTSFPIEGYLTKGMSPLKAARHLWGREEIYATVKTAEILTEERIEELSKEYDVVIRTFPLPQLKPKYVTPIWVVPARADKDNAVLYLGKDPPSYVRYARLFGMRSYEFPPYPAKKPTELAANWGQKTGIAEQKGARLWHAPEIPPGEADVVLNYNNSKTLYVGRWATGARKYLSHMVYQQVVDFLRGKNGLGQFIPENLGRAAPV